MIHQRIDVRPVAAGAQTPGVSRELRAIAIGSVLGLLAVIAIYVLNLPPKAPVAITHPAARHALLVGAYGAAAGATSKAAR